MKEIIEKIRAEVEKCKETGNLFTMPHMDEVEFIETKCPSGGGTLLHIEYDITLPDGGTINIDYQSKDKCRTFQMRPDRSYIEVKCSDDQYNFRDGWDEK